MLERYALPAMREFWSDERKYRGWLAVELAVLEAQAELGKIPRKVYDDSKKYASFSVARIAELEAEYQHDFLAFVVAVQESLTSAGAGHCIPFFHRGLTSYDIEDTALSAQLVEAGKLVIVELRRLHQALVAQAQKHRWTYMIARTHGQFAEPDTFGRLLLVFVYAVERGIARIERALDEEIRFGKVSGAVGTYGDGLDPFVEARACVAVGLRRAKVATQILQRDRHASFLAALATTGGTIEQIARTFWEMMRQDVRELREPRILTQRGSSAMAHKRNPVITERLQGLAVMLRAYAHAEAEVIATPECRDIVQSSVERHAMPGATSLLHYMAHNAAWLVENLEVFPARMKAHLEKASRGVWATQRVRVALCDAGVEYHCAYQYLQRVAFRASDKGIHLSTLLARMPLAPDDKRTARDILGEQKLVDAFDYASYIQQGVNEIFSRFESKRQNE